MAIDIEEAVRQRLVDAQRELAATGAQLKLVEPENIHITMKFLGEIPDAKVQEVADALRRALVNVKPFNVIVRGIGAFPNLRYIRVVWAGVSDGRERVIAAQRSADLELQRLGFPPERDFVPHLTLARVKSAAAKGRLAEAIRSMSDLEFGSSHVRSVELKRSTLTTKGPIYGTLARIDLK